MMFNKVKCKVLTCSQGNPKNTQRENLWMLVDEKLDMSCQCEL